MNDKQTISVPSTLPYEALNAGLMGINTWQSSIEPGFEVSALNRYEHSTPILEELTARLRQEGPYHHPLFAAHMIKPPHPAAWAAWAMASWINPNNQSREASAATTQLELEALEQLLAMFGWSSQHALAHLTTSGTAANLEALWVARELTQGRPIAMSHAAHYNHARIASLLKTPILELPTTPDQIIDVERATELLHKHRPGTLVLTMGTTALGKLDPLDRLIDITQELGIRLHIDAAYGGYYKLLSEQAPQLIEPAPWRKLDQVDSITIDPHKHGLVPYGCGALLYRDQHSASAPLKHHSPYTYQDSSKRHMGEQQLECSRAGAAAAALWAALKVMPLDTNAGMGELLAACRRATIQWAAALEESERLRLFTRPDLDILAFAPWPSSEAMTSNQLSQNSRLLVEHMSEAGTAYFSLYHTSSELAQARWPQLVIDSPTLTLIRACLIKPEHEQWWPKLHQAVLDAQHQLLSSHTTIGR